MTSPTRPLADVTAEAGPVAGRPVSPIRGEAAKEHGWDELAEGYAAEL